MKITQDDVWGVFDDDLNLVKRGMIVAQGWVGDDNGFITLEDWKKKLQVSNVCPVWGDELPYKSVTIICTEEQQYEVEHWLQYVHGSDCITRIKTFGDGRVAMRSEYQCW